MKHKIDKNPNKLDSQLQEAVEKNDIVSLKTLLMAGAAATAFLVSKARNDGYETIEKLLARSLTEKEEALQESKNQKELI